MESVMRMMSKLTGKREEELREMMKRELTEMELEVSAMKVILEGGKKEKEVAKPKPKAKAGGKKKAEEASKKEASKKEEEKEEEEEVEVEEIEYEGVKYLRSTSGVVYDMMTSEEIGRWNSATGSIEVE